MNNRANIMYFIEHLCDMAAKENHQDYVRMMQRDILRVVDAVAPEDGSGAANVKVVRTVLHGLQAKTFLLPQTVLEIEECLKERDKLPDHIGLSSPTQGANEEMKDVKDKDRERKNAPRLDKKQIEQRIEEDRERHKRARENIWATYGDVDDEFDRLMEETSELGEDDFLVFEEEAQERKAAAEAHRVEYETMGNSE
jgi:CTD kinase subunit gamma